MYILVLSGLVSRIHVVIESSDSFQMFTTNRAFIHSGFNMSTLNMLVNIGSFNAIVITISALPNFAIFEHFRFDFSLVLICKKLMMKHCYKHCSILIV